MATAIVIAVEIEINIKYNKNATSYVLVLHVKTLTNIRTHGNIIKIIIRFRFSYYL